MELFNLNFDFALSCSHALEIRNLSIETFKLWKMAMDIELESINNIHIMWKFGKMRTVRDLNFLNNLEIMLHIDFIISRRFYLEMFGDW